MNRLYIVTIDWTTAGAKPYPPLVEGIIGAHGDWLRLREGFWFAYTPDTAQQLVDHLMAALPGETVFVAPMDGTGWWGFGPQWVWAWINARKDGIAVPGSIPPPITLPPPAQFKP